MNLKSLIKSKDFDYVNPDITDENFPLEREPLTEYKIFHFDREMTSEEAIAEIKKEGYLPTTLHELLKWDGWNGEDTVIALGSVWRHPNGSRSVPFLDEWDGGRLLYLFWFGSRWDAHCRFAGVKKEDFSTNKKVSEPEKIKERILERTDIGDWKSCWVYRGAKRKGYCLMKVNGKQTSVHRVLYEAVVAPIPEGFVIDHLCRNKSCINPHHLQPVTSKENTLRGDGPTAKNARKTHCLKGHELKEDNLIKRKNGRRECKQCNQERVRQKRRI